MFNTQYLSVYENELLYKNCELNGVIECIYRGWLEYITYNLHGCLIRDNYTASRVNRVNSAKLRNGAVNRKPQSGRIPWSR